MYYSNAAQILHHQAEHRPHDVALIDAQADDTPITYSELDALARSVAARLCSEIDPGARVAIWMQNGLAFVAAWFGALYAGCTTLPLPFVSTGREVSLRLRHAGCGAILVDSGREGDASKVASLTGDPVSVIGVSEEQQNTPHDSGPPVEVASDALAMLLYTSGTTAGAKAVCISHASLQEHTRALVRTTLALGGSDKVLGAIPLTHSYGIRMTLLVPFFAGATTIFTRRFDSAETLRLCEKYGVTWLPGVPTMFNAWGYDTSGHTPSALKWCLSAGASLPEDVRRRAEARLGAEVRQGYGLTEATFSTINAPPDARVPGTVGKPVEGVRVQICREGQALGTGLQGEVLLRGHNVMHGYLDDNAATQQVIQDGWLHTGDIGFLDNAGRLTVVGRTKDIILRGGHTIYPSEVEEVLEEHPGVRDVAVVGVPDPYYGEEIVAVIVPADDRPELGDLDRFARDNISPIKVPRRIAFVDQLPTGRSGKVLKRELRDRLASGRLRANPCGRDARKL